MFGTSRYSAFALLLLAVFGLSRAAWAAAPANDDWASRKPVVFTSGTFSDNGVALGQATHEATDPDPPCRYILSQPNPEINDVWYGYTTGASAEYWTLTSAYPADMYFNGVITVYTGTPGNFNLVSGGCAFMTTNGYFTRLAGLRLAPNTSYSIKVGATQASFPLPLNFTIAQATQYVVTKTDDTKDVAGCTVADCSLRDAIVASNSNPGAVIVPAGTYTLSLGAGIKNTIDNSAGNLSVLYGMGIYGAGMGQTIIDANQIDRVMRLDGYNQGFQTFILGDLTLQNGNSVIEFVQAQPGGAIAMGLNSANYFSLERVSLLNSVSNLAGAGIYVLSPGTIRDSVISGNIGTGNNAGGGGVYYQNDKSRFLDIVGSTISGNSTQGSGNGGGVYGYGTVRITNSTISGNQAGNAGGGIYSTNGAVLMANDTVVNNGAGSFQTGTIGGGVHLDGGTGNGSTVIANSIIAYNTLSAAKNPGEPPDCAIGNAPDSVVTSYNIAQAPNNCLFNGTGDLTGIDPQVSPTLAANGGTTPTHALIWGGPAIDAGDPGGAPAGCKDTFGVLLLTDQRGMPRPDGARCDIGAFEYQNKIFQDGFEPPN